MITRSLLDNSITMDTKQKLYDLYLSGTVTELRRCRNFLNVTKVKSNARKAELASAIAEHIADNPVECLERLPYHELRLLSLLSKLSEGADEEINTTSMTTFAAAIRFIEVKDKSSELLSFRFAPGMYEALSPHIGEAMARIEASPRLVYEQYLWGCLTIYGMISFSDIFDLADRHFKEDSEYFYKFMSDYPGLESLYHYHYLMHPCVEDPDKLFSEWGKHKMLKRSIKKISRKDILDAGETTPYNSPLHLHEEGVQLHSALRTIGYECDRLVYTIHRIWIAKQLLGLDNAVFNGMIGDILDRGKVRRFEDVQMVANAIMNYYNAIPCWCFKGRSSDEMFRTGKSGPDKLANVKALAQQMNEIGREASVFGNVGRNDPCPCGSGLKYKKCHGKNLS